jgi:hypothetical protein
MKPHIFFDAGTESSASLLSAMGQTPSIIRIFQNLDKKNAGKQSPSFIERNLEIF